jgi:hypothetical protein
MEGCTLLEGGLGDEQEVVDFLNVHFVPLEPINAAIGLCEPGYRRGGEPNSFGYL